MTLQQKIDGTYRIMPGNLYIETANHGEKEILTNRLVAVTRYNDTPYLAVNHLPIGVKDAEDTLAAEIMFDDQAANAFLLPVTEDQMQMLEKTDLPEAEVMTEKQTVDTFTREEQWEN